MPLPMNAPRRATSLIRITRGPLGTVYVCCVCGHYETGHDARTKTDAFAMIRRHVAGSHRDQYGRGLDAAGGAA